MPPPPSPALASLPTPGSPGAPISNVAHDSSPTTQPGVGIHFPEGRAGDDGTGSGSGSDSDSGEVSDADAGAVWFPTVDRVPRHLKLYHAPRGLVIRAREMLIDLAEPDLSIPAAASPNEDCASTDENDRQLDAPASRANFTFVCLGTGGGPLETDSSCYLVKPGGRPRTQPRPQSRPQDKVSRAALNSQMPPRNYHPERFGQESSSPDPAHDFPHDEHRGAAEASKDDDVEGEWGWEDGCIAIDGGTFLGGLERTLGQPARIPKGGYMYSTRQGKGRRKMWQPPLKPDGYPESDDEYSYGPAFTGISNLMDLCGFPRMRRRAGPSHHQNVLWKVGQVGACVRAMLVTHTHLDHTLGMTLACAALPGARAVYGLRGVLASIRDCLFDGSVWPPLADWAPGYAPDATELNGYCGTLYNLTPYVSHIVHCPRFLLFHLLVTAYLTSNSSPCRLVPVQKTPLLEGWLEVEAFPVSHGRDPRLPPVDWGMPEPFENMSTDSIAQGPRDSVSSGRQPSVSAHPASLASQVSQVPVQEKLQPHLQTSPSPQLELLQSWQPPWLPRRAHSYAFDRPEQHAALRAALRQSTSPRAFAGLPYAHSYPYRNSLSFSLVSSRDSTPHRYSLQPPSPSANSPTTRQRSNSRSSHGLLHVPRSNAHADDTGPGFRSSASPSYFTGYQSFFANSRSHLDPFNTSGSDAPSHTLWRQRLSSPGGLGTAPSSPRTRPLQPTKDSFSGASGSMQRRDFSSTQRIAPSRAPFLRTQSAGPVTNHAVSSSHYASTSPASRSPSRNINGEEPEAARRLISALNLVSVNEHNRQPALAEPYLDGSFAPPRQYTSDMDFTISSRPVSTHSGAVGDGANTEEHKEAIPPHRSLESRSLSEGMGDRMESTAFVLHNPRRNGAVIFFGDVESDMLVNGEDAPACPPPPSLFNLPRPSVIPHSNSHPLRPSTTSDEDTDKAWCEMAALASQAQEADGLTEQGASRASNTKGPDLSQGDQSPPSLPSGLKPHLGWTGNATVWARAAQLYLRGKLNAIFLECSFPAEHPLPTLYGHLSSAFWPVELVALARAVQSEYRAIEMRWRAFKGFEPLPDPSSVKESDLRSLRGSLEGLTLIVIHVKSALYPSYGPGFSRRRKADHTSDVPGDDSASDGQEGQRDVEEEDETFCPDPRSMQYRILTELRAWERRARLGIRIELARQGQRIEC